MNLKITNINKKLTKIIPLILSNKLKGLFLYINKMGERRLTMKFKTSFILLSPIKFNIHLN